MQLFKFFSRSRRVYLDYASSTPVDPSVPAASPKLSSSVLGANPSALHKEGVALSRALADARALVATTLDVHSDEVIFTSGATESDNLAICGTIDAWLSEGIAAGDIIVFSSDLEHAAVAETIERYAARGLQHNVFPTEEGIVSAKQIILPAHARAVLVSVMYVSNEIGTIQPVAEIAKRIRKLRKDHPDVRFVFHTDATQASAHCALRVPALGVDLMTLGATKLYCEKGVGALYKKRGLKLAPLLAGGGQEAGLRPGTQPVTIIRQFAQALAYAQAIRETETARIKALQTYFESEMKKRFPQTRITTKDKPRAPHITHVAVPHFDSELLVLELDARGIAVSAKSACKNNLSTGRGQGEEIVEKLYGKGWGAVRFSFGRQTKKAHLDKAIRALQSVFRKYQ